MTDLLARLRETYESVVTGNDVLRNPDGPEAAARIEQLEAALREHACGCVDRCMEDREMYGEYTKFENATCSGARARAALKED